ALLAAEPLAGTPAGAQPPVAPSAEAAPSSGGGAISCPHCSVPNLAEALFCEGCGYDFTTGQTPTHTTEVASGATSAPTAPGSAVEPAPPGAAWVVIVEVDAEWYRLKGVLADQPCPPPSSSTVRLTSRTALVGRTSASRGVRPEIALDGDTGVSRRHAQFVLEPDLITVVDLSSTNGTYVVPGGSVPDEAVQPIVPGVPTVLADGDRVYVGAWTCLTVRSA
ncbi:MAG TPA: phosphopeptide-binding protein, partial [Acidimicrobiaceae bacterium]|nr:phosphopeptide-binding protein [Acidimicrobiaceae bacterium]